MCTTHIKMCIEHISTASSPCKIQEANEILGVPRSHPRVIGTVNNCWGEQTVFSGTVWSGLQQACSFGELSPHTGVGFPLMALTLRDVIVTEPDAVIVFRNKEDKRKQQQPKGEGLLIKKG